jgi:transcriptional regulator with XRE-family HTH domain
VIMRNVVSTDLQMNSSTLSPTCAEAADAVAEQDQAERLRREELGAFVRSRRERLSPEQFGLPDGPRRRTPGLRREEVAQLAGIGVTWYTWLEQGRDINVSQEVLDAIARTLLLDPHERAHLLTLAGIGSGALAGECHAISAGTHLMLDQLDPFPAAVVNRRHDILAYNQAYGRLLSNLDELPLEDRNTMWLAFTHPAWREGMVDWEGTVTRMVAQFRLAMGDHVGEPTWKCLVRRLIDVSPEFAEFWERRDVQLPENRTKLILQPEVGLLKLDFTNLWLGPQPGNRMVAYTPADETTGGRLRQLFERC